MLASKTKDYKSTNSCNTIENPELFAKANVIDQTKKILFQVNYKNGVLKELRTRR